MLAASTPISYTDANNHQWPIWDHTLHSIAIVPSTSIFGRGWYLRLQCSTKLLYLIQLHKKAAELAIMSMANGRDHILLNCCIRSFLKWHSIEQYLQHHWSQGIFVDHTLACWWDVSLLHLLFICCCSLLCENKKKHVDSLHFHKHTFFFYLKRVGEKEENYSFFFLKLRSPVHKTLNKS